MSVDDDEAALRASGERVEQLLSELRATIAPTAWRRVEELVSTTTALYGRGLARVLDVFAEAGAVSEAVREELCDDPLVASLLLLHGLHPSPIEERIGHAIRRVGRAIAPAGRSSFSIELASIDDAGTATLRLSGGFRELGVARAALESALRRAIEDVAPEVARVDLDGGDFASPAEPLVQIDLSRSRGAREATS